MKIKVKDNVKIIGGKDSGKTGKVTQILPQENLVVVEGLNKRVKHLKPQKEGQKGQRIEFNAPIKISKVQIICPKCNKMSRVGYKILASGRKERKCNKCEETL